MKFLPTKGQGYAMPFVLLVLLFISNHLFATPECPIVTARFQLPDGTTADNSTIGWYLDASRVSGSAYFAVKSNRLHAQELGGEGIWYSKVFSTAGYTGWQVAVKVSSEGDMNSSEYVKIYYKINGGSEVLLDQRTGNFGTIDFISPQLNGNNVQLVVKIYNYNNGGSQTSKYYIEEYRVFKEKGACASGITVTATAGNGGTLTCSNPSLTLSASSSASGVSYSWTGPGGFTSTSQNPVVSTPGTYTVVGTNSSGSGSATVTVLENKVAPDLSATGGNLACGASVTLNASSSVAGVTYSWTGPGGFTSTSQNPVVNTAGSYTVTVRNPANGCTNAQTVQVTSGSAAATNIWNEDFSLSNGTTADNGTTAWTSSKPSGSTFAVNSNEFRVSGTGTSGDGVWTSGSISISGKTNVSISINTRSAGPMNADGSIADYIRFYYKLNGGSEVLFAEKKGSINSNSTTNSTVSVAGLSGSSLQIIVRARATGTDEFYYFDNVAVTAVNPAVTLTTSVSGQVTCSSNAQINVTASGTVSSWSWVGPGSFTSTVQNPSVSVGGQYTVTATLPGGCTISAPVTVAENKAIPDVDATGGALGCLTSVTINASSPVSNAQYSWTGPGGFTSTAKSPVVSTAGTYTVTVKDPANGCTNTASAQVTTGNATPSAFWLEDFTLANGTTSDNGSTPWTLESSGTGTISVQNNEFKVSYDAAAEARWYSGVIDISGKSNVVISATLRSETASTSDNFESDDYIRVYYKLNGGAEVLVYDDAAGIGNTTNTAGSITINSDALNGSTLQVIIKARNSDKTERYFFDNVKLTGATAQSTVNATASVQDSLTCARTSINLSGSSNITGVTYSWSGPGGYSSTVQNPAVTAPGNYILTVTNPGTGCSAKDTAIVKQNITAPGAFAGVSGTLSCASSQVTLQGNSATAGVTYRWTGPGGFTSTQQNPVVSTAGTYTLTVTDPVSGCTSTQAVSVISNTGAATNLWIEDFTLANGTTVDNGATAWSTTTPSGSTFAVNNNEFRISGQGTSGESVWTSSAINITGKTGISISADARSSVTGGAVMNETGTYADYLKFYYKLNGGAEVLFAERRSDINNHSASYTNVSISGLSGTSLQIVIRARATGTDEFYYIDNVKIAGAAVSDLTATATVSGRLTCDTTSVTLSGSSNTSGVSYSWTGPGNFTSTLQSPVTSVAGNYILTVTNPATGCTAKDTVTVLQNIAPPGATAGVSGPLSCTASSVTLSGSSNTAGVTYSWSGPDNFTSAQQNPAVNKIGLYTLTVTNPANGCTSTASVQVIFDANASGNLWYEDFALSNGTTVDNGATAWSTTTPSGSTFAVNNNEFKISGQGTTGESVFTSASMNITGKTGIGISADVRSAITGSAVMNETGTYADYIRFYYKLNGGTEVLFAEKRSDINGHSASYTNVSVNGISGTSLQIVIRARATGTDEFYFVDNVKVTGAGGNVDATASVSGPLSCKTTSVTLLGSSTTAGVTYKWTGPGNFTSTQQNPVVTVPGTYTLAVTAAGGCTASAQVIVVQNITKPELTVTQPAVLNCTVTAVNLTAATSTTGATITWTGFAAGQNPVSVSTAGKYYVTAKDTANGCTKLDSVTVTQDTAKPNLTMTAPAVLNCTTTSVNLSAATTTIGATITWTGFTAGQNPVSVSTPGKYYVTVKAANGCTRIDSVTVTQNITKPDLSITQPGILNCTTASLSLNASSAGSTITWTGFATGLNPVTVSAPGKYYVTATAANGCIKKDSIIVTQDITKPTLSVAAPAVLTCTSTSVNLSATSSGTITWTGFAAGQNPISVSAPGKYYVTATAANGCTQKDSVTVTQNITKPTLSVTAPAVLTCTTTSVNLSATSNGTITWTGFAAGQNPVSVSAPGKYYVTATTTNGCTQKDSVTVTQDIAKPTLSVTAPAILTCTTTSVNLSATSNGTITWTGFAAGQNPVSVSAPGKYYVTATATNGCTQKDSLTVTQDGSKPTLSVTAPAVLTCATTSVNLSATSNGTITWTGFTAGQNPVSVSAPGKYYVTATATNGCTQKDSVTVTQNITKPTLGVTAPAVLTCTTTSVNLSATSNGTITWTGFAAGQNPVSVSAPGKYYVTATATNGCTQKDSVIVTQDIAKPNLTVTQPAVLTCATTSVNLTAATTTNGATITWTGFAAGQNPVSVGAPGKYYVTAAATNGCTQKDSVTVTQDVSKPTLSVTAPAVLTCATTSVNLSATSSGTITWTGFAAGQNPVSVSAPGKYYVTATATNGCTQKDSVTVTQDITKPNLTVTQPAVLTCATISVNLTAATTTNGATITWTGFAAGQNPVSVGAPGKYYVTAAATNGCTQKDSVTVTQDGSKPTLSVAAPAVLTCTTTSVNLSATSNGTITWTGFAAGQNPVSVSAPGKYYVTATATNGCTQKDSVTVTQDITKPTLSVSAPAVLTCATTSVNLSATSNGTITWTGFATGQNPVSVSSPGKYYATATAANGCTQKDSVTVTQDITKPNLTVTQPAVLTCATTSVNLTAATTTNGAIITWTGFAAGQNPASVSAPGKYYVTATATNGCTQKDSVTVTQDVTKPTLTVTVPAVLTCATTSVNLSATSNGTIAWTGFPAGQNPVSVSTPGKYYATANATNGCTQIDSVTVTQNITKPTLSVTAPAVLTCATTSVNLSATSNGTTITWAGFSAGQNPVSVTAPGKYYVTATATNGCTQIDSVTVTQNITKPTLSVTAPAVLTCANTSVNLSATSNGTTITWTGFTAGQNPVSVSAPGKYYVTATAANGCTQIDSVTVTQNIIKPTLSVTAPAVLTCATTSVNLSATSNGTTITWAGFTAGQNPVSVSAPGKYYITATATNGCTQKDSVTVTQDITKPTLSVTAPAVLTCATTSVNLSATSNGTTITWTGFATGQNPVSVSAPGKYYVTATAANGCTQKDSVTVTQNITKPTLSVTAPAVLTCATTSVNLSATSNGTTITWTGFTAGQNPVSVSAPGKYYVTATAANGCTQIDSVTVTQNIIKPTLSVTAPAVLTCATTSVNLSATSNGTITWTGFTAGQNPVSVSAPGKYYVTATATNGCTQKDSVTVTQDITKPTLSVTAPAVLTCATTSVNLSATSNGTTITWTGFTAGQNPVSVSAPGKYYVTATAANGCTQIDSVTVTQNIIKPTLSVTAPAVLTCATTSVNLSATSNGAITWTGFPAGQNPVSITAPGKYYVTATAANGCTQIDSVTVTQNITKPTLSVTAPAVLTCTTTSVSLSATSNGTITWTGFTAGQNPVSVSAPGKYYATATATNGCIQKDSVTVTQNITKPTLSVTAPAVLTCATTSVNLSATSNGTTITWTGFPANQNPVSVTAPGKYYVTATATNGCTQKDSITVTQDITKPVLTVTQPPVLTCLTTSVNLSATAPGATITWTGFTAGQNPVSTALAGKYYVTATGANGCTQKDSITVAQDITPAANVQASNDGPLTCAKTTVKLTGSSTTPNATYKWSKDGVQIATTAETNVVTAGTYALTVTNPANGCAATTSTPVQQNITPPGNVQATNDGPITCSKTLVNLSGQSSTTGVTYKWTKDGVEIANTANTTTTVDGLYTLTVTNPNNGCAAITNTRVNKNVTLPAAVINPPASQPTPLTVDLLTAQSVSNATYAWTFTSSDNNWQAVDGANTATFIYQSGSKGTSATFTLVVVDKGNNCRNTAQITLTATQPTLTLTNKSADARQVDAPLEYKAYPNPFTDKMYITFKSPVSGKVTVALYGSRDGAMEKVLFNDMAKAGLEYKLTLDGANLTSGMHLCVISANGKVYTSKLILLP